MSDCDGANMSVVIVVNSCDAYSDLWDLFFLCMSDYWGGCEYPVVLNTESKIYSLPIGINFDVTVHHHEYGGVDLWGERLISTLNDTSAEFVIVIYDDFFLNAPVDQERLMDLVNLMLSEPNIGVVYLTKLLGVQKGPVRENGLAVVGPAADYRLNSSPAIWRKDTLLKFTGRKDNPWAWEYFGSYRTFDDNSVFLAVADSGRDIYPYDYRKGGAIYRGKWVPEVIDPIIERHQLDLDLEKRGRVNSCCFPKRDFAWKLTFMATGVQMIGHRMLFVIYRIFRGKISGWLGNINKKYSIF
jgi:hypothetical protein